MPNSQPDKLSFDYIIVGAGSAGCVLANKLSEDPSHRVLLLEAGPMDRDLFIHVPAGVYRTYRNPRINWNYVSEAERELLDRGIDTPRGKVVGGSSSINSMVYMRGHPLDFDVWADDFRLPAWSFDRCLPYFKAGESYDRGADAWRGGDGLLGVSRGALKNPLIDAFLEAGRESGQGYSEDLNGYRPEGVARMDSTKRRGRRCSAAVAFLRPVLDRPNLTLETRALVKRVLVENHRVVGVEYSVRGENVVVRTDGEVILSGGAINSPQLLLLSGIGPEAHLKDIGVPLVHRLPGVGRNLQDHATVILKYACTKPVTLSHLGQPVRRAMAGARWLLNRTGPAASNIWEAGGLVRSTLDIAHPNVEYHFAPVGFEYDGDRIRLEQSFSIHVDQSRPASRGHVELASPDPAAKPRMFFNYLSAASDQRDLVEGVRRARELIAQPAFDEFRGREVYPGKEVQSDAQILAFLREYVATDYHPCGTCRMGHDDMSVVDGELRVHGVEKLRVIDASVMPRITCANLNAPTMMIAARAADFILGKPQLAPVRARFHFRDE